MMYTNDNAPMMFLFLIASLLASHTSAIHFSSSDPALHKQFVDIIKTYSPNFQPVRVNPVLPQNPINSCPHPQTNQLCNFENAVQCHTNATYSPNTVEEAQTIVKNAVAKGLRVRVVGHAHSDSAIWCDDEHSVVIFSDGLNRILNINLTAGTIEVEAGAISGQVHDALHTVNRSLEAYYPAFRNLTIGGLISTGSYGSSLDTSSVLADSIISLDLIDARGNLRTLQSNSILFDAARTSLGTLGMIVRVTLPIVPQFKIRMEVLTLPDSVMQQQDFVDLIRNGTYVGFGWYPRAKVIIVEHGRKVRSDTPGDGKAITFDPDPKFIEIFSEINELLIRQPELGPMIETLVARSQSHSPNYRYPNEKASVDVTGWSHHIMCGTCSDQCPWFYGLRSKESAYIFPLNVLPHLVRDITALLDSEEHRLLSFPLGGFYFRFGKPTKALLGFGRHAEWFVPEVTTWRPRNGEPLFDQAGLDEIERLMSEKYQGIPHWGKNDNTAFVSKQNFTGKYGADWQQFWQTHQILDPHKVFLSPFISSFLN